MQGARLVVHQLGALEQVADVADHDRPLFLDPEKPGPVELGFEMGEEIGDLALGRRHSPGLFHLFGLHVRPQQEPLISDDQDRLRQIERAEGGAERCHQ